MAKTVILSCCETKTVIIKWISRDYTVTDQWWPLVLHTDFRRSCYNCCFILFSLSFYIMFPLCYDRGEFPRPADINKRSRGEQLQSWTYQQQPLNYDEGCIKPSDRNYDEGCIKPNEPAAHWFRPEVTWGELPGEKPWLETGEVGDWFAEDPTLLRYCCREEA